MNDNKAIIAAVKDDPMVIQAMNNLNEVKAIQQTVFQKGVHYGAPYKGSKNDTLLKPGATFLQQKFQLHEQHERLETTIHVDTDDLSKSYIIIQNRCRIFNNDGLEVAQADAACTTFEDKYVYRGGGDKTCPTCNEPKIIKSKFDKGWYCLSCKAKFAEDDAVIVNQDTTKKLNPNPLNLLDTIVAMAQKRASVRATIKATGIDALFSPGDGVTVDYYDDMEQSSDDLISVVDKNAPESHQEAVSSDLAMAAGDYKPATPKGASKLGNSNGGKGSITYPATSYRYRENLGKVKAQVQDLYLDADGKLNTFHMNGSIEKLEAAKSLDPNTHTVEQAVAIIRQYKAAQAQQVPDGAVDLSKVEF